MQQPGFWDDQQRAASLSAEHSRARRRLETFRALESELDDLEALAALGEDDESIAGELDEQLATVAEELARLGGGAPVPGPLRRRATPSSRCTAAPVAPTPRTGRRCCCACTCAGRRGAASRSR